MTLTLAIRNLARLDNGSPTEFVLHQRGAVIGRAPTCDWSLPDPRNYISSRHLEVRYDGRGYQVTDTSTNGTFLNGAAERMDGPRRVEDGDRFQIGHYDIAATLSGEAAVTPGVEAAATPPEWRGWDAGGGGEASAPAAASDWGAPATATGGGFAPAPASDWGAAPAMGGGVVPAPASDWGAAPAATGWDSAPPPPPSGGKWQPQVGPSLARPEAHRSSDTAPSSPAVVSGGWAPSARAPDLPVASAWAAATPTPEPASGWSSAVPDRPAPPTPDDVWGRIAEGNVVDWARGGFGQPVEPAHDPLGLAPPPAREALPREMPQAAPTGGGWAAPAPTPPPAPAPVPTPPPAAPVAPPRSSGAEPFLVGAGLSPAQLPDTSPALLERAGALFHRLIAGLVVMVEARARAKAQLGAENTAFTPEGNNPLKYARTPDEALQMLLGAPQRGFMPAERAIEDAFRDLQSHQMATLRAMQGALKATLDRFSPAAIRTRAEGGGLLERIVPAARDAALWQAYEREFGGVAQGSDEAFMDVFAKEFRHAYNEQSRRDRR